MTDTVTATPQCEARTGVTPGQFGFQPVRCKTTLGTREMGGHRFCGAPGHEENVRIRFGLIAPPRVASSRCESGGHPGCSCDVCF